DAAHAVADGQADIPEQGQEAADGLVVALAGAAVAQQDQQVDIRMRMELTASVAAHGEQGDVAVQRAIQARPGLGENLVGQPGAVVDQFVDVALTLETGLEYGVGVLQCLLESAGRAAGSGQIDIELAAVEQFVIHNGSSGATVGRRVGAARSAELFVLAQGQQLIAIGGDQNGVPPSGRQLSVRGDGGPAVGQQTGPGSAERA